MTKTLKEFDYIFTSSGKLMILYLGRQIMVVKGERAYKLHSRLKSVDFFNAQLILAKATKNFKRGNESLCKLKQDQKR
ncbi:hypothetical protein GN278_06345 [Rhodobacteraceae bacterium Araon29]